MFSLPNFLRHCLQCGLPGTNIDLYCPHCWKTITSLIHQDLRCREYLLPTYTLFRWGEDNDHWLRPLIYALKGGGLNPATLRLVEHFSSLRLGLKPPWQECLFVPSPPRHKPDHATQLAEQLAQHWRAAMITPLQRDSQPLEQKQLSRSSRAERKFRCHGSNISSKTTIIFVDDLVTTGATAIAAYKALGSPTRFEVWALAARESLASSVFL